MQAESASSRVFASRRRAKAVLQESERRFESLFRATPVPTYVWRRKGHDFALVAHNDAAEVASKAEAGKYHGAKASEVYREDPSIFEDLRRADQEGAAFSREMNYTIPGTTDTYRLLVTYASAPPDLVVVSTVNLTPRLQTESELQRSLEVLRRVDAERLELLGDLVSVQEHERERIATDVHDDPVQMITALALRLAALRRDAPASMQPDLQALERLAEETIDHLRSLTFMLHPPELESEGLGGALRILLERTSLSGGFEYELRNRLSFEPSRDVGIHAYRIAQEALSNIRKHAGAHRVEVTVDAAEGELSLVIHDDGVGFDRSHPRAPDHFGLTSMRRRSEIAGGRVEISTAVGSGTLVDVRLPLR